jgi:hypothetical protein
MRAQSDLRILYLSAGSFVHPTNQPLTDERGQKIIESDALGIA